MESGPTHSLTVSIRTVCCESEKAAPASGATVGKAGGGGWDGGFEARDVRLKPSGIEYTSLRRPPLFSELDLMLVEGGREARVRAIVVDCRRMVGAEGSGGQGVDCAELSRGWRVSLYILRLEWVEGEDDRGGDFRSFCA